MNSTVTTRITRIGNSKGIIVPTGVVKALALEDGDTVELSFNSTTQELIAKFPTTKQLALVSHLHNT